MIINKAAAFRKAGYTPHRAQVPLHRSRARNKVAAMGRRTGKSTAGGYELVFESIITRLQQHHLEDSGRRREFWIVGPNYTDSEKEFRVLWNAMKRLKAPIDRPGSYYDAHAGDMQLSMFGGLFLVIGKSAAHPERLVGEGLCGVIMAEAAKMKASTWEKYIRPMLADFHGWAQFNSTPEGKNWFYRLWMMGQNMTNPDWDSWRLPAWYNPVIFPLGGSMAAVDECRTLLQHHSLEQALEKMKRPLDPEIGAMVRDLPSEVFNQEVAALFTEYVGRVFKEFDEETHVRDLEYDPQWPLFAACDYGFTNPFVWLLIQVDVWGNVYVIDEFYRSGLTIDEAAQEILAHDLAPRSLKAFYPDPASPGDTKALEKRLKVKARGGTGGELETRLRLMRAMLRVRNTHLPYGAPERAPRLLINRRCTETIREMNDYRYPKTATEAAEMGKNAPEKPLKKDDHCPEALGRFMAGYFGAGAANELSRVVSASFGRR